MASMSYSVGAVFEIYDRASPVLKAIAAQFAALDAQIAETKKLLDSFAVTPAFERMNRALAGIEAQFGKVSEEIDGATASASALGGAFARVDGSIAASVDGARALRAALLEADAATAAIGRGRVIPAAAGGGGRGSGIHLRGSLPLAPGVHAAASAGDTLGPLIGAAVIGWGLKKAADEGGALAHQQSAIYRATGDWNQALDVTDVAFSRITSQVPTAAASDVLRSYNELRTVVGAQRALDVTPMSLEMEALIHNLTGKDAAGEGFKLWRALEMKGVTMSNPAESSRLANQMINIIAGSGGKVSADTYQLLARRGGAAWISASPSAIGPYSVMAADLGGEGAGTALMTLRQLLTGATTISRQQLDVFNQAGLIDMGKVRKVPGSNAMQVEPGAIYDSLEGANNVYAWAQAVAPKLHTLAETIGLKEHQDPNRVFDSLIAKIGRNRNAIKMLTMFTDPGFVEQIDKDLAQWNASMDLARAYNAMLGRPFMVTGPGGRVSEAASDAESAAAVDRADWGAVTEALGAQMKSAIEAVGVPVGRALIPQLRVVTDYANSFGSWADHHKEYVSVAADIAAVSTAFLGLGGALKLLRAAIPAAAGGLIGPSAAANLVPGAVGTGVVWTMWKLLNGPDSPIPQANRDLAHDLGLPGRAYSAPFRMDGRGTPVEERANPWSNYNRAWGSLRDAGITQGDLDHDVQMTQMRGGAFAGAITLSPNLNMQANLQTQVNVSVDGKAVAAVVESKIVSATGFLTSGAGGSDSHAHYSGPGGIGHQ